MDADRRTARQVSLSGLRALFGIGLLSCVAVTCPVSGTRAQEGPGDEDAAESEQLLSTEQVVQGLAVRVQEMQDRYEELLDRTDNEPRDYSVELPPADLNAPPPPDASGGEIDVERQEQIQ